MIALVRDPELGPAACPHCGRAVVWAVDERGTRMALDAEPAPSGWGIWELYTEVFPDGSPVEPGMQRVRLRPHDRPDRSPGWNAHLPAVLVDPVVACPVREDAPK